MARPPKDANDHPIMDFLQSYVEQAAAETEAAQPKRKKRSKPQGFGKASASHAGTYAPIRPQFHPLAIALEAAVPLHILQLQSKGGPSEADYAQMDEIGTLLGSKGDVLLFGSKQKGEAAHIFNRIAYAIAVLSFCPGGVRAFNAHYDGNKPILQFPDLAQVSTTNDFSNFVQ